MAASKLVIEDLVTSSPAELQTLNLDEQSEVKGGFIVCLVIWLLS